MGNVLETFYIMFASNADELDKGAKEAKGIVDKLDESLASTDKRTQALGTGLVRMAGMATAALGAVVGFGAVLHGVLSTANMANELLDLSNAIGVSVEDLSAWSMAVSKSGGTAQDFQNDIKGIATDMAQISVTGKSKLLPFFRELGVSVTDSSGHVKKAIDLLPELADAFSKVSPEQALGLGQKLGLSQGTIMLLQQGRREVEAVIDRQKELGVVTTKQAEIAKRYNDTVQDTAHSYRTLTMTIGSAILPAMTWFFEVVQSGIMFLIEHKDLAVGFFIALAGAVMAYAVPAFITLAAATLPIWGPIAAGVAIVGALAAAFALLYEDVMIFVKGGDSLIGRVLDWLNGFESFRIAVEALGNAFGWVADKAEKFFGWLGKINSEGGPNITATGRLVGRAQQQIGIAGQTPLAATTGGAIGLGRPLANLRNTSVQIGEVNVQTQATDAEGMAGAAAGALSNQMRQAQSNFDDGVAA